MLIKCGECGNGAHQVDLTRSVSPSGAFEAEVRSACLGAIHAEAKVCVRRKTAGREDALPVEWRREAAAADGARSGGDKSPTNGLMLCSNPSGGRAAAPERMEER